jgi:hypothetical protein
MAATSGSESGPTTSLPVSLTLTLAMLRNDSTASFRAALPRKS